ncbi:MAG: 2-succinyl-5-enolpyruvyl-6-hydroxy-3-cyclohexene-1-carboxylate synthase, partial [Actinobacteria bacterium]|nr:2-succinyl-5-enolpyruvyl-6-hydroxy-3-cyclohexene-1-carboxylate synthase [Actinomycetota bacterium]
IDAAAVETPPLPVENPPARALPEVGRLAELVSSTERGVVVAGGGAARDAAAGHDVGAFAARAGWPLIAEPHSGARVPPHALSTPQALLLAGFAVPDVVLQLGAVPTSRATSSFVASAAQLVTVDADGWLQDPTRRATTVRAEPSVLARALSGLVPERESAWSKEWWEADRIARTALDAYLDGVDEPFETRVARDVAASVADGSTLFVSSSMPIRDLDIAMAPREGVRVLSNRGASGIDGFVSSALGAAPCIALCGDLSFLHDAGGFLWGARRGSAVTFVVIDNNGGGIFDLLPHASLPEHERFFVTPHGLDLRLVAEAAGTSYARVERARDLVPALSHPHAWGARVVHLPVDRARAVTRRAELLDAVRRALA